MSSCKCHYFLNAIIQNDFLQLIFLMEAGDVIRQFSEEIFHRVSAYSNIIHSFSLCIHTIIFYWLFAHLLYNVILFPATCGSTLLYILREISWT